MSGLSLNSASPSSLADAKHIVEQLHAAGHYAYIAGGAARDLILGRKSRDYDIATSASTDEIEALFEHTLPVGAAFGVVLVMINGNSYDVATFRSEGPYLDGRRPSTVRQGTLDQDASRRDFTINSLYLDPIRMKVVDPLKTGKTDLDKGIIRFVGDAEKRVNEDHLRILRAVRFKNTLGFKYHPDTVEAIRSNVDLLAKISAERIRDELITMLLDSNRVAALTDLLEYGLLKEIIPEIYELHKNNSQQTENVKTALGKLPKKTDLRLVIATLLQGVNPYNPEQCSQLSQEILQKLRFPRLFSQDIVFAIRSQSIMDSFLELPLAKQFNWFLDKRFPLILGLAKLHSLNKKNTLAVAKKERDYRKTSPGEPVLLLKGNDLLDQIDIPPGPVIGELLQLLREAQLTSKVSNREEALALIRAEAKLRSLPLKS